MKFFFDNNLPRRLAGITKLAADGPWYIISIDRFKKHHDAEREALRRAGHTVFVLDSQWSRHTYWLQCERLVRWWPTLVQSATLMTGGAFRVPWQYTEKTKLTAIKL